MRRWYLVHKDGTTIDGPNPKIICTECWGTGFEFPRYGVMLDPNGEEIEKCKFKKIRIEISVNRAGVFYGRRFEL